MRYDKIIYSFPYKKRKAYIKENKKGKRKAFFSNDISISLEDLTKEIERSQRKLLKLISAKRLLIKEGKEDDFPL